MKISVINRILKEDLSKAAQVPAWVDALLSPLNQFIDLVGSALKNRLTFLDNFAGSRISISCTHNTQVRVNPQTKQKVAGVLLLSSGAQIATGFGWQMLSNGLLGLTVQYSAGGTTAATCIFQILVE